MKKIYFTGAIRGGRSQQPTYVEIATLLKKFGTVLGAHVADETISDYGETDLSKEAIHDREIAALKTSDVVVAEVTTPSLGVGYLIAQAIHEHKPIVCLYQGEDTYKLSAMIKGNGAATIYLYSKINDLEQIFLQAFGEI